MKPKRPLFLQSKQVLALQDQKVFNKMLIKTQQESDEERLIADEHQGRIVATIKETCKLSRPFPIISIKVSFNYVYNM